MATFSAATVVSLLLDTYDVLTITGLARLQITVANRPTYETSTFGAQSVGPFGAVTTVVLIGISAGTYATAPSGAANPVVIVNATPAQIASPTAAMLAAINTLYQLNGPPYTLYQTQGTELLAVGSTGVTTTAVQALIDASTQNLVPKGSAITNLALKQNNVNILTGDNITDPTSGLTMTAALAAIRASIQPGGATAPVTSVAPSLSPGIASVGATETITAGTYSSGTVISRKWNINVNGSIVGQATTPTFAVPASAGLGARQLSVTELYTWANGVDVIGLTSATYLINAPAAVPVANTVPTWGTGTPQVGTVFTLNAASWTNTPTSYTRNVYSGWVSASNKGTVVGTFTTAATTSSYTIQSTDAGATLVIGEVASNGSGAGVEVFSTAIIITSTAGAPQWVDAAGVVLPAAILPSFPAPTYNVGDSGFIDLGVTVGNVNPNGYTYQFTLDGNGTGMPGAANVSAIPFTVLPAWSGHNLGVALTASNAGGISRAVTVASVPIAGAAAGGTGSLSGAVSTLADNATGTAYALNTLGPTDWAAYINGSIASPDTKSGGPARITTTLPTGTGSNGSATHNIQFLSWTGGTPNATGNGDGGFNVTNAGAPCDIRTVISGIGTSTETVTIWLELVSLTDTLNITASLSDGSASNWTYSGTPAYNVKIVISVKAGASAQSLTIDIANATGNNVIGYQAVAIS